MNRTTLGVELIDCAASVHRVALPEDLLEIAQQQPFDDIRHDRVLLPRRLSGLVE